MINRLTYIHVNLMIRHLGWVSLLDIYKLHSPQAPNEERQFMYFFFIAVRRLIHRISQDAQEVQQSAIKNSNAAVIRPCVDKMKRPQNQEVLILSALTLIVMMRCIVTAIRARPSRLLVFFTVLCEIL